MAVDLSAAALEARQQGIAEVMRLLAQPEDLSKLPDLLADYASKAKANKATLSSLVQSQVEAARRGLDLVNRSHRHVLKLRSCIDNIHKLCAECTSLIDHQDKIRVLSTTHANLHKVLAEIKDIIDLPDRAETVLELMQDPANILPAYEALTVLEGTAEAAKAAWNRNVKAGKHDMTSMMQYLERVKDAMAEFEALFWEHLAGFEDLAKENPTLLVDCLRIIEIQERLDRQITKSKIVEGLAPKRFKAKLQTMIAEHVAAKFAFLMQEAPKCGQFNKKVKYTSEGDIILDEKRDYMGNLVSVVIFDGMTNLQETISEESKLRAMDIIEEELFDENEYLDAVMDELYEVEADLADTYDHVAPCFPPSYNIFDQVFQLYHVQVAMVIDTIGQRAKHLSTKGSLRVMEFVRKYMSTLRNLGVEEQLVRLPVSPMTDPDTPPGLDLLMSSYIQRMEMTVTKWYTNIMVVDLEHEPKPGPNGKLRTPGVTDFFRIMNEEIEVIRSIDDHGMVMLQTARMALRLMRSFQAEQTRVISDQSNHLSLEMFCALLNNNVECHDQSLEFVEEVKESLDEEHQDTLEEVEEVCRGFLEVAKVAAGRAVQVIFNDPGMSTQLKGLYSRQEWFEGRTTAVLIATIRDYMGDVHRYVEPLFIKRVAEAALEELVKRCVNMFIVGVPGVNDEMVNRMGEDERHIEAYFSESVKPLALAAQITQLRHLREILAGFSVEEVVAAYKALVAVYPSFTIEALQKILDARGQYNGFEKKHIKDVINQCRTAWKAQEEAQKAAQGKTEEKGGFFASLFGRKAPEPAPAAASTSGAAPGGAAARSGPSMSGAPPRTSQSGITSAGPQRGGGSSSNLGNAGANTAGAGTSRSGPRRGDAEEEDEDEEEEEEEEQPRASRSKGGSKRGSGSGVPPKKGKEQDVKGGGGDKAGGSKGGKKKVERNYWSDYDSEDGEGEGKGGKGGKALKEAGTWLTSKMGVAKAAMVKGSEIAYAKSKEAMVKGGEMAVAKSKEAVAKGKEAVEKRRQQQAAAKQRQQQQGDEDGEEEEEEGEGAGAEKGGKGGKGKQGAAGGSAPSAAGKQVSAGSPFSKLKFGFGRSNKPAAPGKQAEAAGEPAEDDE